MTAIKLADLTWRVSWFQTRAAPTGKARSPTVDNRVQWTTSDRPQMVGGMALWLERRSLAGGLSLLYG